MSPSTAPEFYLSKVADEIIIKFGKNPTQITSDSKRVLVIGGGVTGLTSAWALLDQGYQVTVVSDKWASLKDRITSQIAGALWEWPPAVCGKHTNVISLDNSKRWCMTSYRLFDTLMKNVPVENHGVRMRMANFFFENKIENMPEQLEKMLEIEAQTEVRGFLRDPALVTQHSVNQKAGVEDSYRHLAPIIDTDHYMGFLRRVVESKGGKFITAHISGDLLQTEDRLRAKYRADAIVNATGLSAYESAADKTVTPLRGALIRVVNDGTKFPKVTEALAVSHDDSHGAEAEDIVFIVPRNDRILLLGGLVQPHVYSLDLTLESPEIIRMRERCNNFVPGLENAEYDVDPLVQGLRPFRESNVRVEREERSKADGTKSRIVHSYGQGGSGFTLSFGCASDLVDLMNDLVAEIPRTEQTEVARL